MSEPVSRICSVARIRALDAWSIAHGGVSGDQLMEAAGLGAFRHLRPLLDLLGGAGLVVLTGKGNNAGDGFVVARLAHQAGVPVRVVCVCPPDEFPAGDARTNAERCRDVGLALDQLDTLDRISRLDASVVVIDALLGTGLSGDVRPPFASVIHAVNRAPAPVFALDIPSGLDGDTGRPLGTAIRARWTATFGALKPGLLTGDGPDHAGEVYLVPLPFPTAAWDAVPESP